MGVEAAWDLSRDDNMIVYWGQNSYGASAPGSSDPSNWQKPLGQYCNDDGVDAFYLAFLTSFVGIGGYPEINLANTCSPTDNGTFPGTNLAQCQALASDIQACQSAGKPVILSLGGAGGAIGFTSDEQAEQFADTVWNLFLGGSNDTRPFGDAVLDGVDLDIEGGGATGYSAFVTRLQTQYFASSSKKYYTSAAPQCPYPDAYLGTTLNSANFDVVFVQFYSNSCGNQAFPGGDYDYAAWDNWSQTESPNKGVKLIIGAPASSTAAGIGYVPSDQLITIVKDAQSKYDSCAGAGLWDMSQAAANGNFQDVVKSGIADSSSKKRDEEMKARPSRLWKF